MQAQLVDLYRAGIRSATDMMKLSLEHTERFQQQQLQLIRHALDESTRSTTQAGELKGLDDMVAFNSRVAGAQLERVSEFWANWWRAAGDMQKSHDRPIPIDRSARQRTKCARAIRSRRVPPRTPRGSPLRPPTSARNTAQKRVGRSRQDGRPARGVNAPGLRAVREARALCRHSPRAASDNFPDRLRPWRRARVSRCRQPRAALRPA